MCQYDLMVTNISYTFFLFQVFLINTNNLQAIKGCLRQLHKNATRYIEQILEATSHKTVAVRPPTSYL